MTTKTANTMHLTAGPELSAPAYDRHVVDTIKRLQCIQQLISDPQNFHAAGRELLEWCSDARAFTPNFEPYLLDCLNVVRQRAQQEGYELDLSYRILAICAANGEKFLPQAAANLRSWSEELGKALLLKHKSASAAHTAAYSSDTACKSRGGDSAATKRTEYQMQTGMQQPMLRKQYSSDGQMGWPMDGGAPPGARGPNGLQVVTTVWGMTPGTQVPSSQHAAGYEMYQRGPAGQPGVGYPAQQPGFYRQNSIPAGPGRPGMAAQYRPQYNPPPNGNPDYQPPPGALSAAAMVAAAATATATATATASMMVQHQQQEQQNPHFQRQHSNQMAAQYGGQYGGQRLPGPGGPMPTHPMTGAPGPMPSQQALAYRRPSPYPQNAMMQRKAYAAAHAESMNQYRPMNPQPTTYNPAAGHPHAASYPPHMRPGMGPGGPPQSVYENGAPPPYSGGPYPNHVAHRTHPGQPLPSQPYPPQSGYMMPHQQMDVKPVMPPTGGDIQLTFPIRDGIILPPFRLEHNLQVSHHVFHLKEQVFQTLMERQDSEVQLKCFHHEDRQQSPNWPAQVSISVNGRRLLIDRGEQRSYHKPLYLKSVCMPGKNTLTISVCNCCCSHLFFLQLVHRPTVKSILQGLLKKRFLPAEQCIAKIKANFANFNGSGIPSAESDGVEQTSVKISLKCPITFRRITLPARGHECRHIQCFDLESYLQMNAERGLWRCPVCNKNAMLEGLEIDQYMWGIINELSKTEVDEVNIEATASWKPVTAAIAKEEDNKDKVCLMNNSWMKVYSPSSTNLPSVGSYEAHHNNPMSPYPTPPNSHNSQGSNSIAHFNGGMYDVGFNSPPDFTGPMSNRSDMSENDKRMLLQRQQSGIASPQGPQSNAQQPPGYSMPPGGPASMPPGGPASNAPMSQGPPSNAPASQGPPSNAPPSAQGPPSNAPGNVANQSPGGPTELPSDINDLVNNSSNDSALDVFDDVDLLAYLGPQDSDSNKDKNSFPVTTSADDDEILALFAD